MLPPPQILTYLTINKNLKIDFIKYLKYLFTYQNLLGLLQGLSLCDGSASFWVPGGHNLEIKTVLPRIQPIINILNINKVTRIFFLLQLSSESSQIEVNNSAGIFFSLD